MAALDGFKIYRLQRGNLNATCRKQVCVSQETLDKLAELSEQTGYSRTALADYLLSKAIDLVKVVDA